MEGSKESADEEDGWQGGGGYRWAVFISNVFSFGRRELVGFLHIRNAVSGAVLSVGLGLYLLTLSGQETTLSLE